MQIELARPRGWHHLEHALRGVVLTGLFLCAFLPLLVAPSLVYPQITGKALAFEVIAEVMTAAWLVLWLYWPDYRPRRTPLLWSVTAFILLIGISDALGPDPTLALWGNLERMEGYVLLVHLFGFFLAASSVVRSPAVWDRLLLVSAIVSAAITAYGYFEIAFANAVGRTWHRVETTFGNPAFFASYLLLHIFLIGYLISKYPERRARRVTLAVILLLEVGLLPLTGTRGALIGLMAGAATMLGIIALSRADAARRRRARLAGAIAIALVLLVGGYGALQVVGYAAPELVAASSPDRLFDSAVGDAEVDLAPPEHGQLRRLVGHAPDGLRQRLLAGAIAVKGMMQAPILGSGQESFERISDGLRDPRLLGAESFDRVHNVILDWAVAGGIAGLLAFLGIFVAAARARWHRGARSLVWPRAAFVGLLVAHLAANSFLFDTITSYVIVFALLAYAQAADQPQRRGASRRKVGVTLVAASLAVPLLMTAVGWRLVRPVYVSARVLGASGPLARGPIVEKIELLEELLDSDPYSVWEVRRGLAWVVSRIDRAGLDEQTRDRYVDRAVAELRREIAEDPHWVAPHGELASLLVTTGRTEDALPVLEETIALFPNEQNLRLLLASALDRLGRAREAAAAAWTAHALDPTQPEPRVAASLLALVAGDSDRALALLGPLPDDAVPLAAPSLHLKSAGAPAPGFSSASPEARWIRAFVDYVGRRGRDLASSIGGLHELQQRYPGAGPVLRALEEAMREVHTHLRRAQTELAATRSR